MTTKLNVNPQHIQEMRDLIDSGDLDLTERRQVFKRIQGRVTKLSDDDLIVAVAMTDDDDDDLFVANVITVEASL